MGWPWRVSQIGEMQEAATDKIHNIRLLATYIRPCKSFSPPPLLSSSTAVPIRLPVASKITSDSRVQEFYVAKCMPIVLLIESMLGSRPLDSTHIS
eukprot:9482859-Pyramimonas_sp.AAC.1